MKRIKLTHQGWIFSGLILLLAVNVFFHLKNISFNPTSLQVVIKNPIGPDSFYEGFTLFLNYNSNYPNLGSVEVRFNTHKRINTDLLEFRIKEVGQADWYYQAEYKVDQFQDGKLFPFGFPTISDSKDRSYQIEIESKKGVLDDSVALSEVFPQIVSRHVFGKKLLLSNPRLLIGFIFQKAANLLQFPEFFSSFLIFATPLMIYVFYLVIGSGVGIFSLILITFTVIEAFWVRQYYSLLQLSIALGWLLVLKKHKVTFQVPIHASLLFFVLAIPLNLLGFDLISSKVGAWTFWFLCLGTFQFGFETFGRRGQVMSLLQYLRRLIIETWNTLTIAWLMAVGEVNLVVNTSKIEGEALKLGTEISKEEFKHRVTLIVKRLGASMIDTYLVTSWFISSLIIILVNFLNYAFKFGPYLFSAWLVWFSINRLRGYSNFFQSFFITDQSGRFWSSVGYYFVIIQVIAVLVFLMFQRKKVLRVKTYYLIAILLVATNVSRAVFNISTLSYRDKPTIWITRPEQPSEPWVDVTIVGRNFGEKPFGGKVFIDGVEQRVIDWRNNEIIFRTNPVTTKTGNLSIKTRQDEPSNTIMFIYTGNR